VRGAKSIYPNKSAPMSDESVKVAVRVRPFNNREKDRGAKCVIRMDGPCTYITNPEDGTMRPAQRLFSVIFGLPPDFVLANVGKEKRFAFDFSYWSHNSADSHFATNPIVFQDLGISVLENAWSGTFPDLSDAD
jgi:kinesin family member 1